MCIYFFHAFSVKVEALQWANLSSKESYQIPIKRSRNSENRIGLSCHRGEKYFRHKGKKDKAVPIKFAYSGGWSPNWVHSAPRPFTVLLCLPRMIVRMGNYSVE
jgi:hypothetical protein